MSMIQYDGYELEGLREAHNYYSWIIQEYSSSIKGKVLDIGAGIGMFTEFLLRLPIRELVCLEPDSKLFPILEHRLSCQAVQTFPQTLEQFGANSFETFDTLTCINVLEHIEDDYQALATMNRLLRVGGSLCLFVPAISRLYGTLDKSFGHHRRYSKGPLESLLTKSGFKVRRMKYFHATGILTWILMGKVLRWRSWDPKLVKIYDRLVTPITFRIEKFISPPIGQSLLLVGTKTNDALMLR